MREVTLSWHEVTTAAYVGIRRRIGSLVVDRPGYHGIDNEAGLFDVDVDGAAAELAVAKSFGVYWHGAGITDQGADAGVFHVRHTRHENGSLIIRHGDRGQFILAVGVIPTFRLFGPVDAELVKADCYRRAPNGRPPAYFVPQEVLA